MPDDAGVLVDKFLFNGYSQNSRQGLLMPLSLFRESTRFIVRPSLIQHCTDSLAELILFNDLHGLGNTQNWFRIGLIIKPI